MAKPVHKETVVREVWAEKPAGFVRELMRARFSGEVKIKLQNGNLIQVVTERRESS